MQLVYDEIYGDHLRGIPHPESPDRVEVVADFLRRRGYLNDAIVPRDATDEELLLVHSPEYLETVKREIGALHGTAGYLSTGDTVVDEHSLAVARRAAGGAIVAAEYSASNRRPSFAIVRPPGHHAEGARGMGFCVFNNAAIAARAIAKRYGLRTLVVDFDYHHGNGTQAVSGDGLSYVSTHAYPAYPGTGSADETYRLTDAAVINVPLPPHRFGTEPFIALWEALLPRAVEFVKPQMLIVSAGFDYVAGDPVGDLGVSVDAARSLAQILRRAAAEHCENRIAYVLEGGYDTRALGESIAQVIESHDARGTAKSNAERAAIPEAQRATLSRLQSRLN